MPGLLGTTSRLCGESQRNQRDHCRRRGSTGRSKPWRAKDSVTRRVKASIQGSSSAELPRGEKASPSCPAKEPAQTDCQSFSRAPGEERGNGHRTNTGLSDSDYRLCFLMFTGGAPGHLWPGVPPATFLTALFGVLLCCEIHPFPRAEFQGYGSATLLPQIVPVKRETQ